MEITNTSSQSKPASRGLQQWLQQHPLFSYFFLAYAISWILTIPVILSEWHILPKNAFTFYFFFTIKSFGPFLAAYIMTRVLEGKEGVLRLKQSIRQIRAGWQWYLFILLGIPTLMLFGILCSSQSTGELSRLSAPLSGDLPGELHPDFLRGRTAR